MSIIPKDYTPTIVAKTHLEGAQFRDMEATPALTVQRTLHPIRATCTRPSASRLTASFPAIFGRHRGGEGRGGETSNSPAGSDGSLITAPGGAFSGNDVGFRIQGEGYPSEGRSGLVSGTRHLADGNVA